MINLPKSEDWSKPDNIVAFIESVVAHLVLLSSGNHTRVNHYLVNKIPEVKSAIDLLSDSKKKELLNKIYTKFESDHRIPRDSENLNEILERFGLPTGQKRL